MHGGAGFARSTRPGLPEGIAVLERAPSDGWGAERPVVVLVHGSLDRATSMARTARRLPELGIVVYDRRGYQGSRAAAPASSLHAHVEDLLAIAGAYRGMSGGRPGSAPASTVCAVGHSVGGTIVLAAAVAGPATFSSVGAYEPSMPWLGFRRPDRSSDARKGADPGEQAERFFRRMVGDGSWRRLSEHQRAERRADGPALVADLASISGAPPFDVTELEVPAVVAAGGEASAPHHRDTADWLAANVAAVERAELADAGHGAHLSHPDAFAALVRRVAAHLGPATPRPS